MAIKGFSREGNQIIIHTDSEICTSKRELLHSEIFDSIVELFILNLRRQDSPLLDKIGLELDTEAGRHQLIGILRTLCESSLEQVASILPQASYLLQQPVHKALHEFVERLYDFWRSFDRFMILHSEPGPTSFDQRPYRAFNDTIESLTHLVRSVYRDLCENITGDHPRIYRQVAAGCNVGLIAVPKEFRLPREYQEILSKIPFIRQVWIDPPIIIDPPMNKRTGQFQKVDRNPFANLSLQTEQWLCYPAQVGPLVIFVYFHQRFIDLGCALANLFELATDEQIAAGPAAVYMFGAPSGHMSAFGDLPTVFYDDDKNRLLVAAVPLEDRFGYFGYLKKMILTLHNVVMMKRGRMPYHGAMVRIILKSGQSANILLVGDTAAGKSESLEAFRILGKDYIREMRIIADDMGSLEVADDGHVLGYGTEIGAFIRLDDLQQGYAFGQIDRAIIMSPHKENARVVLPVTTSDEILCGYPVDFFLYANNYERVDESHPIIERFDSISHALRVFRKGAAMAKGTTTSMGMVHSYFANIFGPPQYKDLHEGLADKIFRAAFNTGIFVGQIRTRLGIPGYEAKGPEEAATALLNLISKREEE
jgi:hypothetical protein